MRANEFISESHNGRGKLHPEQIATMPRAHSFAGTTDRAYDLNRAMMAVACSDGKSFPHHGSDSESWVGKSNMANPFTEEEHNMLHHAYKSIGIDINDTVNHPNKEPDGIHKVSPVAGFKGYKRK
jgi:hypothetical protein